MERLSLGRISKINVELGYGFVESSEGAEIFFSPDTIVEGALWKDLKVNDQVSVEITETERGAFAKILRLRDGTRPELEHGFVR